MTWKEVKLGDICEQITVGHVGSMADQYTSKGIPFLRSQNVRPYNISLENLVFIGEDFNKKLKKSELQPGDLIVVRTGYPGTAAVIPNSLPVCNCSDLVIIRPGTKIDANYLCCVFNSVFGQNLVGGRLVGAAQQHFNITTAKELKILIPPLPEQKRIAGILSAYDELIENNKKRIALLEKMAEEIYKEWFVRMRFLGYQSAKFVNGIPEGWELKRLSDVCELISGCAFKSADFTDVANNRIVVRMGNFKKNGGLQFSDNTKFLVATLEAKAKYKLSPGDMLIVLSDVTREGTIIGNVGFVPSGTTEEYYLNQRVSKIVLKNKKQTYYYYGLLLSQAFKNHCLSRADSATVLNLSNKDFYEFQFVLPPENLCLAFCDLYKSLFNKLSNCNLQNQNLQKTRDRLLTRLMKPPEPPLSKGVSGICNKEVVHA